MPIKLSVLRRCWLGAAAGWPVLAMATGLGPGLNQPQLGAPLDFVVQVRTDPGETIAPECVSAEVLIGERRLPASLVRTAVDVLSPDSARVRVLSTPAVDEPVVTVTLTSGCVNKVSRRYVLLVEPPSLAAAPMVPPQAVAPADVARLPAAAPATPPAALTPATAARATTISSETVASGEVAPPSAPARRARAEPSRPRAEPAARDARVRPERQSARQSERRRAAPPVAAATPAEAAPRLRLEAEEPVRSAEAQAVERAMEAVAQAASAARAAASAASASAQRIASLEGTVEQLRGEAKAQRELAAELREQLAASRGSSRWVVPLMLLVLALSALALWLAWRLSSAQRHREIDWRQAVAPPPAASAPGSLPGTLPAGGPVSRSPTSPIPFVTSEIAPPRAPARGAGRVRGTPAWPPPAPPNTMPPPPEDLDTAPAAEAEEVRSQAISPEAFESAMARTQPLPPGLLADGSAARDVSIEELIDLEQQAEFFVVLGQDDAAIELLVEHLRNTGGGSPLPYLKLLEIYHRRSDREDYERIRTRFNRRFNAYAPEWGVDLAHGRSLDDYSGVVPRLQAVWAKPIDAMAELEALLFRKSRGELFDLPAYREVLFLYALARDHLDRETLDSGSVDLLLPMNDGTEFGTTTPHPYLGLESDAMPLGDERATLPLDFDVSRDSKQTSIFDPLRDDVPSSRRG